MRTHILQRLLHICIWRAAASKQHDSRSRHSRCGGDSSGMHGSSCPAGACMQAGERASGVNVDQVVWLKIERGVVVA